MLPIAKRKQMFFILDRQQCFFYDYLSITKNIKIKSSSWGKVKNERDDIIAFHRDLDGFSMA